MSSNMTEIVVNVLFFYAKCAIGLRIMSSSVPKSIESGDLRALGDLRDVGRMKYLYTASHFKAVNTLVHRGDHVLITTRLALDRYIADFYAKTGK